MDNSSWEQSSIQAWRNLHVKAATFTGRTVECKLFWRYIWVHVQVCSGFKRDLLWQADSNILWIDHIICIWVEHFAISGHIQPLSRDNSWLSEANFVWLSAATSRKYWKYKVIYMFDKNIWLQNISLQHCWNAVAALVDANFTGLNLSGLLK